MKEIQLTRGSIALVDDDDFEWLSRFSWRLDSYGYAMRTTARTNSGRTSALMHREILGLFKGDGLCCDHINGDKLDNRRANLRVCSTSDNNRNQRLSKDNTSGFKGVCWNKQSKKWQANITVNWKQKSLGLFATPSQAHDAYQKAAIEFHGDFANFGNGCVILESGC